MFPLNHILLLYQLLFSVITVLNIYVHGGTGAARVIGRSQEDPNKVRGREKDRDGGEGSDNESDHK
jgi:hypothetical protein